MAQHDQNIANGDGATVRQDINDAMAAIFSQSSGSSAPGTTVAHQPYANTTSNLLQKRNAANTGWINIRTLDETFALSRGSNTILDISDVGKTIWASSTFTQTFTAAATLADGWFIDYYNTGSGIITFDPNSTEQINGATTLLLYPGEGVRITCNGSAFRAMGIGSVFTGDSGSGGVRGLVPAPSSGDAAAGKYLGAAGTWSVPTDNGSMKLLNVVNASGASNVSFSSTYLTSTYDDYVVKISGLVPSASSALKLFLSNNNLSSFISSMNSSSCITTNAANSVISDGDNTYMTLTSADIYNNVLYGSLCGDVGIFNINAGALCIWNLSYNVTNSTSNMKQSRGGGTGFRGAVGAINSIKFELSTGTITGNFRLYGIKKS